MKTKIFYYGKKNLKNNVEKPSFVYENSRIFLKKSIKKIFCHYLMNKQCGLANRTFEKNSNKY